MTPAAANDAFPLPASGANERLDEGSFESMRTALEAYLSQALDELPGVESTLAEAMRYSLLGGGKRLRASLVLCTGQALGVSQAALLPAAAAIEALHAYSLVHDDMPCMDNDTLRRGKPTCHVKFGQAMALLAGDALQTTAFQWLSNNELLSPAVRLAQVQALSLAAGPQGMCTGQAIDLVHVGQSLQLEALKAMHARKTGDLIVASMQLAYLACDTLKPDQQAALEDYAKALGLAYQVLDDILDVESSSEQLGKTSGKDAAANKPTMVSLLGLPAAKEFLESLSQRAHGACDRLGESQSASLRALITRIVDRKS